MKGVWKLKLLMCNLKANKTFPEFNTYLEEITKMPNKESLIIFPPYLYLSILKDKNLVFGSQDVSLYDEGSNTGEVAASQIKSTGASYVIVGHSERRSKFNEDEYILSKKIKQCLKEELKVVYCIGETLEEKLRHKTYQVLEKQIAKIFNNLSAQDMNNVIIAYEPIWAIGSGKAAKESDIEEITPFIKKLVLDYYDLDIKVLYGGSVNKDNIASINKIKNVDGYLVGKASLNPEDIAEMLKFCVK